MPHFHCARGMRPRIRRWRAIELESLERRAMLAATNPVPDETVDDSGTETVEVSTDQTTTDTNPTSGDELGDLLLEDDRLILEGDYYGLDPIFCLEPTLGTRKLPSLYDGKTYDSTTTYVSTDELVEPPPEDATLDSASDADNLNADSSGAYVP